MFGALLFLLGYLVASVSSDDPQYMTIVTVWVPDMTCNSDDPNNSSLIYGIEINLLKNVYERVNWTEGQEYYYQCMSWPNDWDNILNNNEALWYPSITINSENLDSGFIFSQVLLHSFQQH